MHTARERGRNVAPMQVAVGFLAASFAAGSALAGSVTIGAANDNTLYESATGTLSNGAGEWFFVGRDGHGAIKRGLIAFDVAGAVPAGSTITGVTLTLYMSRTSVGAEPVELHRVLADWGEGASNAGASEGAGATALPGDATWRHRFYNTGFWTTPGGDDAPAASASTSVGGIGYYTWTGAGLVTDVQAWLDLPAGIFGWLVQGNEAVAPTAKRFDSRQSAVIAQRPALTVEYVPEPATGLMLAMVALFLRGRGGRRRVRGAGRG